MPLALLRVFPFLAWLPRVTRDNLRVDALAGLTVALVAIPQSLAYAQLAGLPPYYGLYAALIPTILGALFGSSAQLSTGPVALTSLLTAASIAPLAAAGSDQYIAYAISVALLSGLFQLSFGLMRLGVLMNLLSHPVLMGFVNAAAILITLSQVPALFGVAPPAKGHALMDTWHILVHAAESHGYSVLFGVVAIAFLVTHIEGGVAARQRLFQRDDAGQVVDAALCIVVEHAVRAAVQLSRNVAEIRREFLPLCRHTGVAAAMGAADPGDQ
jgi:SulP family sulfate permease